MEKLHKYCLSVLLVIVCNNISAHTNNKSIQNVDCKQFYEIYSQFLAYECKTSQEFCLKEKSTHNLAVNKKQNAIDLIAKSIVESQQEGYYDRKSFNFSEENKHCKILKNFEKQNKQIDFVENNYFKNKVSKIRNKDYLD